MKPSKTFSRPFKKAGEPLNQVNKKYFKLSAYQKKLQTKLHYI